MNCFYYYNSSKQQPSEQQISHTDRSKIMDDFILFLIKALLQDVPNASPQSHHESGTKA